MSVWHSVIKNAAVHGDELMAGHHNVAMGQDQMYEKLTRLAREKKTFRLDALNDARQIVNLQKSLDEHKRLLQAIADSELPRVHQLVRVGIDHGDSARAISKRLAKAAKEFTRMESTNDDKDLALLTLRIGGPFLLYAHQRAGNLPGKSTARGHSATQTSSRFRVSLTHRQISNDRRCDLIFGRSEMNQTTAAACLVRKLRLLQL